MGNKNKETGATQCKSAEDALRESEIKYKTLFASSADAIMILTSGDGFSSGNPAAIKLFGCKNEADFISKSPADLSPERQPDGKLSSLKSQEMMKISLEKGSNFFEWVHRRIDGKEFPATVLLTKMELQGKQVLQATVRDITEQKRAQDACNVASQEWDRTFDAISDFVFIMDKDNNILRANKAFMQFVGKDALGLAGKKCYEIVHGSNHHWPHCPFEETRLDHKSHTSEIIDPKLGIPLLITVSPILDEKGEIVGAVHIAKDISERKKIEDELKAKVERLERFQKVTVGRELKMRELKQKISELEAKFTQAVKTDKS